MKLRYKIANSLLLALGVAVMALAFTLSHNSACEPAPSIPSGAVTMQAIVHRCYGSSDVLSYEAIEKPTPADGEVLVKIHAASVNPLDWHYMRGTPYVIRVFSGVGAPDEIRLGVDFAGTVDAVGSGVTRFKPGDEVFGRRTGAFAEYVVVGEDRALAIKPANVTFEQAAAVPIAGVTALQALRDKGGVGHGTTVLINGASGGVGTFAVQIAKVLGADVTGVCSTRNVDMVRSLGADDVIDYTRESYVERGVRFDVIIDNVGNHSISANRRVLTPEGTLVLVGGSGDNWLSPFVGPLTAMTMAPFIDQKLRTMLTEMRPEDLRFLAELMRDGKMTPVIDRRFALRDVPAAIDYSEQGHARGKIIIEVE